MVNESERTQSEFNDALGFLGRLNTLFHAANLSSISLDAHQWYNILLALFRELSEEMTDEETTMWKDKKLEINNQIQLCLKRNKGIPPQLYFMLDEFEIFLRSVYSNSGLKNRFKDDPREAL